MKSEIGVLIVDDDPIFCLDLRDLLAPMGYLVVGEAADAQQAVALARKLRPDLVIMDVRLPGDTDGIAAAAILTSEQTAAVLLVTGCSDLDLAQRAADAGATGYLLKPLTEDILRPAMHIALSSFRHIRALQQEVLGLREEQETRQLIDRAVDLIISEYHLSAEEASARIRTASTTAGKSPRAVAEAIILAQQVGTRTD
jgi:two-component system, response regulator PdtaR